MKSQLVGLMLISLLFCGADNAQAKHHKSQSNQFAQYGQAAVPAQVDERIILMRHAEKPDSEGDPNLTIAGYARAQKLPDFIVSQYGRPDYIFVAADSKHSMRPSETALPLSKATGVPLSNLFADKEYQDLAQALTQDSRFRGKLIVVVWHHGTIPAFARLLGAKDGSFPDKWKSSVFNQFLCFDYVGKNRPVVNVCAEPF